jgi:hypothetical protein
LKQLRAIEEVLELVALAAAMLALSVAAASELLFEIGSKILRKIEGIDDRSSSPSTAHGYGRFLDRDGRSAP